MTTAALRILCVVGVVLVAGGIAIVLCLPYPTAPFGQVLIVPGGVLFGFAAAELNRRRRS